MATTDLYNVEGQKIGTYELKDEVFNIDPNPDLMWRYVDYQLSRRRSGTASTKTRGEVSGGGRKPWIQKHTGRARHGSIRSPIWRHGGVSHGPKPRDWSKSLPKKMKRLAVKSAISQRYREGNLIIMDDLKFDEPKSRNIREVLKKFDNPGATSEGKNSVRIDGVNVLDILNHDKLVLTKDMAAKIEEVLG